MQDQNKTQKPLIAELCELRQQFAESEKNITERKETRKAPQDSEAKYRQIVETANAGIWTLDENFEATFVNRRMVEMLGYSESEMIGRPVHWFMFEEDLADLREKMRDRRAGISDCYERRYRHKDGRTLWVMLSVTPLVDAEDGSFKGSFSMVTDITERKLMEEKLRLSEEKYRSMVETTTDCIWEIDPQGRCTYLSPRFEDQTGYPPEDFLGRTLYDLLPEDEVHKAREQVLSRIGAQLPVSSVEAQFRHRDGRLVTVEVSSVPIFGPEGEYRGRRGIARDITERKQAEEALKESKERYRSLLQNAPAMVYRMSLPEGIYEYVNDGATMITGFSPEEWLNTPLLIKERIHPEFTDYFSKEWQALISGDMPPFYEFKFIHKSGDVRWVHQSNTLIRDQEGKPVAIEGVVTDVTERKGAEEAYRKSEERFRVAQESSLDAFTILDAVRNEKGRIVDFRWTYVNPEAGRILRHPPEELVGKRLLELLPGNKSNSDLFSRYVRVVETGEPHDYELFYGSEGIQGWFRNMTVKLGDGVAVHFSDITDRKRAEEERRQLEQRLHQAQKAESLGRMAGAIAHHFNSLLGAVMGRVELALGDPQLAPRPREHLNEAIKASQRAAEISRLMLTYLGQTVQRKEPCNILEAVREALLLVGPSLPQRVHVQAELPHDVIVIQGDKAHIEQALTNLLLNAGEAVGNGDGRIMVSVDFVTADKLREFRLFPSDWAPLENSYVSVSISDSGCGFEPAIRERIFDPFFSTKFAGRGLGLAVVLGIVRAHGGGVAVESQPGVGSVFRVFFPLSAQQTLYPGPEPAVDLESFKDGGLVLVVEDEPLVREMAEMMLKEFGYDVILAGDGLEALEKFRERQDEVCLVLLDQSLPGMNGWETLAALRALRADLRVVLTSGYDQEQVMRGDCPEQPLVFLRKPYHMKDLEAALGAAQKMSSDADKGAS